MPLTPIQFPGFAGSLNLRDQPSSVDPTQAIDLMNTVPVGDYGLRERDGYTAFNSVAGTNRYDSMVPFYKSDGTRQLVVGAGNRLEGLSTAGAVVSSSAAPTTSPHFFARFGGPTGEFLFCANGADQLRKWDGATFTAPGYTGTAPTGKFVAVTPWDNRMVNARRTGAVAGDNPSTVRFSAAGDPLTWGANDYVDLEPGDGEAIQGIVTWQDKVFVFKETKFFFFYATSVGAAGTPVFNYRPIETGVGLVAPKAVAVARDAVYFLDRRGVYRTTGGPPELVSPLLDPLFYGGVSDFYLGGTLNMAQIGNAAMTWHREQIYVALTTGTSTTNNRVLLFDPRYGWWTLYDLQAAALASFRVTDQPELVFALATGNKDIERHGPGYVTDAGATITTRWKSGGFDYRETVEKVIRECEMWGKGSLIFGIGCDYQNAKYASVVNLGGAVDLWSDGTGTDTWGAGSSTDLWAAGQSLKPAFYRDAVCGTTFSIEITNNGANPWALYRLSTHVVGERSPGEITVAA